ncbi:DUF4352 domain-containing protein [Paenibacillus dakarensis]|uniref:DUF4352 domain-containing protein n=1 Tax=Paenibacillus dakarensis TaxID=1527293 RepID=UPI0006D56162|nr:DUF4352 domain-containing protein [Paenibacillus dakarensis]
MTNASRKTMIFTTLLCSLLLMSACSKETSKDPVTDTAAPVIQNEEKQNEEAPSEEPQSEEPQQNITDSSALLQEAQSNTVKAASDQPAPIGEWLNYHGMVVRVDSVRESAGDDYLKPQEGNVMKVLEITVANIGDKEQVVSSALLFKLSDDSGQTHMPVVTSDIKQSLDGVLAPDQVMQGEIPYEVSKNAKDLKLTFSVPLMEGEAVWTLD